MSKVAVITDSTAYLPENLVSEYNITVLPLVVIWGDETLRDNIDISVNQFYERLTTSKTMPSTSQTTIQTFADAFEKLHNQGYEILTVVISSALSGTLDSAIQAKKMVPEATIELFDSRSSSLPLAYMALSAARAAKRGASLEECKKVAEAVRSNNQVYFAVDTLEFLHRGGRIGGASRFLGTALGLKPILYLKDGKVEALEKVRTSKRAHNRLIEILETNLNGHSTINMIGVVKAAADEAAEKLLKDIKQKFTPDEIMVADLSPVLGTHIGPGAVGVSYVAGVDAGLLKGNL
jgi:DegV family protein with EDD domain